MRTKIVHGDNVARPQRLEDIPAFILIVLLPIAHTGLVRGTSATTLSREPEKGEGDMAKKIGISVTDLYGGRSISAETARRSMAALETRLRAEFKERTRLRKQFNEPLKKVRVTLLDTKTKNNAAAETARQMRALHKVASGRKLKRVRTVAVDTGIFTGMSGATVAPPFDYQWTWGAVDGKAQSNIETANRTTGTVALNLSTDRDNSSSVAGRAAVGIYFYPPRNGSLQIWSTPAFNYLWGTVCDLASAHADAWIGLYVGSYDLAGSFVGEVIDQRITLWTDDSWLYGSRLNTGSNSGYGIYAPPIPVDRQHQYIIWVWCGGEVSADGFHLFNGSGAVDQLNISVPSITWELNTQWVVEA